MNRRKVILKIIVFCVIIISFLGVPIQKYAKSKTLLYIEDVEKNENTDKVTVKIYAKNMNADIVALRNKCKIRY